MNGIGSGREAAAERREHRRAVVLVGNPAHPYSRALRIARALVGLGYTVEIAAVAAEGLPESERDDRITTRRYRPRGGYAALATLGASARKPEAGSGRFRVRRLMRATVGRWRRWILWPHTVRGWWATLDSELASADLYHACGSLTVAAALAARRRDAAAGRRSVVVYDAIDDVMASNNVLDMPGWVRRWLGIRERRWAAASDARLTVNEELAQRLARRWRRLEEPVVVPNWPEPVRDLDALLAHRPDLIRERLGLAASTRVVVFQGRLGPNLGLDEAAEAILRVPDAVLALVGFGRWEERCRARDADPRFAGRHVTLPAVHPDDLVRWTASADVALVPLPPVSANQRASTPNKFWEALVAGTPVVIGPDLPVMAALVERHDLGVIARSLRPDDLAAAINEILALDPAGSSERRARIARLAADRFDWRVAESRYKELVLAMTGMAISA